MQIVRLLLFPLFVYDFYYQRDFTKQCEQNFCRSHKSLFRAMYSEHRSSARVRDLKRSCDSEYYSCTLFPPPAAAGAAVRTVRFLRICGARKVGVAGALAGRRGDDDPR